MTIIARERTMTDLPQDLAAAVAADPPQPPSDLVLEARALCEELRDKRAEVADLEDRLEKARAAVNKLRTETLVDLMDRVGVSAIELAARGNYPAARVEIKPYVKAVIEAGWPEERRRAAFDWLDADGSGDLIKTTIVCRVPREARAFAVEVAQKLRQLRAKCTVGGKEVEIKMDVEVSEAVAWATLTAWLKERVNRGRPLGTRDMDVIGGYAGRVADLKVVGEK